MCVDSGASLHTSHHQLKQWAREITVAEPSFDAQKPLKWSSTPLIFDAEDHPDRTTAVGCLPLLVSPTIRNLKVNKMLVDGGAGLNLISPVVIKRLQIPYGDLEETGTFQGVNPGRSQPKGKVTLPVTFGGELAQNGEDRLRRSRDPLALQQDPRPPSTSQVHGGVALRLQHAEAARAVDHHLRPL